MLSPGRWLKKRDIPKTEAGSLRSNLDGLVLEKGRVSIRGWYASLGGPASMEIRGVLPEKAGETEIRKERRPDVADAFHIPMERACGFRIRIPRENIPGRDLTLVFRNGEGTRSERIDMRRFDFDNTRLGRLLPVLKQETPRGLLGLLREKGPGYTLGHLEEESVAVEDRYDFYAKKMSPSRSLLKEHKKINIAPAPLFSILIPADGCRFSQLDRLLASVRAQSYGNWQALIAGSREDGDRLLPRLCEKYWNDRRISWQFSGENGGSLLEQLNGLCRLAEGEYLRFTAPSDLLDPDCLYRTLGVIHHDPEAGLIYADEDHLVSEERRTCPLFKPDYDPVYLCSYNYIGYAVAVRADLAAKAGCFDDGIPGSEMYDFLLRCMDAGARIRHIRSVLSTRTDRSRSRRLVGPDEEAGILALQRHYERTGTDAVPEYTGIPGTFTAVSGLEEEPLISILIPNKDHTEDLAKCIGSIRRKTTWKNYEILVIENNSEEAETFAYYEELSRDPRVRIVRYEGEFNYSRINNLGAAEAQGEFLLLLNNDTEVISGDWLGRMAGFCRREEIAVAGARLYYPDNTIQHAGIAAGIGNLAGHTDMGRACRFRGTLNRTVSDRSVSAVTGACMMVRASVYRELGGLSEDLAVAFNDVDFCLRVWEAGYRVVYVPEAELYHYESKSRGLETTPEKAERFARESGLFRENHKEYLKKGDPFYNPNLTLESGDYSVRSVYQGRTGEGK